MNTKIFQAPAPPVLNSIGCFHSYVPEYLECVYLIKDILQLLVMHNTVCTDFLYGHFYPPVLGMLLWQSYSSSSSLSNFPPCIGGGGCSSISLDLMLPRRMRNTQITTGTFLNTIFDFSLKMMRCFCARCSD